ncbi:small ribosomal subunit protein bS21c-like [Tasmannia lanceolata]|uniref:small ribosomal subunit protein bS21c-like n=1 Tax=Tasmannia lanceolata TaxID=3420 RepID=UPI0040646E6B
MAASFNFPRIPFSTNPNPNPNPSLRPFPISIRTPISAKLEKPLPSIRSRDPITEIDWIVNPSIRYANVMFFRSGYNVQVMVDEGEPEEVLLRRFKREVSKAGVIQECKRRRFFENKQEEKKRKVREAGKRNRRRRFGPRFTPTEGDAAPKKAEAAEDEDNWDMPAGGLPH